MNTLFSSIWLIDWGLSGATTLGQSDTGSDDNEGVFCIPQSSSITGTSQSDCSVSYLGHSLGGGLTPLQRSSWCILQLQPTRKRFYRKQMSIGGTTTPGKHCSLTNEMFLIFQGKYDYLIQCKTSFHLMSRLSHVNHIYWSFPHGMAS